MFCAQGQDLSTGNLTAPAVYALAHPEVGPELEALVQREFDGGASLPRALELVAAGGGIQAARRLARQEADMVRLALTLPASSAACMSGLAVLSSCIGCCMSLL